MKQPEFIRLEHTFEEAMRYRNAPNMAYYHFGGVHLLPNELAPYVQRTYNKTGIEIEDPEVTLMSICGDELADVSVPFNVTRVFQDLNGQPQIEWSLKNVTFDAGYKLVYLRIKQGANDFIYSSPFYLTSIYSEYTARVHYTMGGNDTMLSTGLDIYFKQPDTFQEVGTYDTVNTSSRTTITTKLLEFEVWQTRVVDIYLFGLIKRLFTNKFVYFDYQRTTLFEAFETPRLTADENFADAEILLVRDENEVYNPFYVPPVIPTPPPPQFILLEPMQFASTSSILYSFTFSFGLVFSFGDVFLYEYSLNQVEWTSVAGDAVSPTAISVPNYQNSNYYYRIRHEPSGTISNVRQYERNIVITNVIRNGAFNQLGNKHSVYYTINGFTPSGQLSFDVSTNGTNWQTASYNIGNQNPKEVSTLSSNVEFKYFRIRDNGLGITSNTYQLP